MRKAILLLILGSLLLCIAWPFVGSMGWILPFGLVPFFMAQEHISTLNRSVLKAFFLNYLFFLLFNTICTWWVYNASAGGAIGAILLNTLFMSITSLVYVLIRKKRSRLYSFCLFTFAWISFEYLHLSWQLSWPWLTLGNGLANHTWMIQWYEITGVLGGSLWILISSYLGFILWPNIKKRRSIIVLGTVYFFPIFVSLLFYFRNINEIDTLKVGVLQPNVDAYEEKFTPIGKQKLWYSIENHLQKEPLDLLIFPETALFEPTQFADYGDTVIPYGLWLNQGIQAQSVQKVKRILKKYPNTTVVSGVDARILKDPSFAQDYETKVAKVNGRPFYYQNTNASVLIDSSEQVPYYIKSKLVIGVETYPYPSIFIPLLGEAVIDKGGTTGSLGIQDERSLLSNSKINVATPICYESIYGDFCRHWTANGATFFAVLTNDGWWGDTPGYKQHLSLSRLRAIENRKWIARSANTGISAFIDPFGNIVKSQGWFEEGYLNQEIITNNTQTFYVKNGDIIGRLSALLFVLLFVFSLTQSKLQNEQ